MNVSRRRRPIRNSRVRDYAAEYARRKAKGAAAGKTTAQARGHHERERYGKSESQYRRERSILKYGAAPSTLSRLRAKAVAHISGEVRRAGAKRSINQETIRKGVMMLRVETLEYILTLPGESMRALAALDPDAVADEIGDDPEDWPEKRNPFWYG